MIDGMTATRSLGFDRSTKGTSFTSASVTVERGRIVFFAQVLGTADPVHIDVDAAQSAGHPDLLAPPSFFMVIEALAEDERRRAGMPSMLDRIGCDLRYLLHGDEHYDYVNPIYAGDVLMLTTTVVDFYEKKGGAMEFVTLRSVVEHASRGILLRATRTLLHRFG